MFRLCHTPLCPAGHLPLKGGDHAVPATRLISPLEGEMSGRTEGGERRPIKIWKAASQ
jgi:hypothetical protein